MNNLQKKYAILFIIFTFIEVFIAIYVHDDFIRPFGGDILVIFVIYCFMRIFLKGQCRLLPLYVFGFAALVEISQYFHFVEILGLQNSHILRILMGTTFDMADIYAYGIGALLLVIWQRIEQSHEKNITQ